MEIHLEAAAVLGLLTEHRPRTCLHAASNSRSPPPAGRATTATSSVSRVATPPDTRRITRRARGAVLNWFEKRLTPPIEVYEQLRERAGFGDDADVVRYVRERYGEEEADALRQRANDGLDKAMDAKFGTVARRLSASTTAQARARMWQRELPRLLLMNVPDGLFATAIEGAIERQEGNYGGTYDMPAPVARDYVNELFEAQGIPYRLSDEDRVEWVGDEAIHEQVIEPALNALRDPRLETPREDFEHALENVRKGTAKARKDAVNDGTKALEGAMVAVLEANGHTPPERRQVFVLWEVLRDHGLVPPDMMEVLTAGSKVSNKRGRHTNPEPVTQAEAEASVASVGNAISYLGTLLP
jgi:hypothetical protein